MRTGLTIVIIALLIGIGFFVGNKWGNRTVENYTNHTELVREIAELSTLEVSGMATLNQTNVSDGTMWSSISNFLGEKTILLNIPYTAKYGCNMGDNGVKIRALSNKKVEITLEKPKLLSYEMRLDQMRQFSKNGLLVLSQDNKFAGPQKKLYKETKLKLEANQKHIAKAKLKIEKVLGDLMAANGITAKYKWE